MAGLPSNRKGRHRKHLTKVPYEEIKQKGSDIEKNPRENRFSTSWAGRGVVQPTFDIRTTTQIKVEFLRKEYARKKTELEIIK